MGRLDPRDLYELSADRFPLDGAVLVHTLDGFVDAGRVVEIARDHLLTAGDGEVVARFDVDQLHDYRARRPPMRYSTDHWAGVTAPELTLRLLRDDVGAPFLLLAGPEPDVQWERFFAAVGQLVDELGVRLTVGMSAFPMGVPHTRATRVLVHGTRPELREGRPTGLGELIVPGSVSNLLELRFGEAGRDAVGLAAPVPPYLAQTSHPAASVALLSELAARTGLLLPLAALEETAGESRAVIDEQVARTEEVAALVAALEEQYDTAVAGEGRDLQAGEGRLPSADELGAELERYLAEQAPGD